MKKHFSLPLVSTLLIYVSQAQITILSTDMAQIGDTVSRVADTMTALVPGPAGANKSWVMTNETIDTTEITKVMAPSSTPYSSSFSGSNVALTNDNKSYLYFNQTTSASKLTGLAGDLLNDGNIIIIPFNPSMLLHNFPRTYGSNFSDNYTMDVTINGTSPGVDKIRFKRTSTARDTTDGWGIVTTPVGKYNCLRVKRVDFPIDSIWVKPFFPPTWSLYSTKKDTIYGYSWLAKQTKLAVAELGYDSLDKPKKFTWSLIAPFKATITSSNSGCNPANGACNGQATAIPSGFFPPFTYNWSNGQTNATASGLCGGSYSVTVSDSIGNMVILIATITQPPAITLSATSTNASSATTANGTATVIPSGGITPFSYSWSNGQTTATATALLPATYSVTVTTANGCSISTTVVVGFNVGIDEIISPFSVSVFPNPSNESITLNFKYNLQGEYFFLIYNSQGQILRREKINVKTGNSSEINIRDFLSGFYIWSLEEKETSLQSRGNFCVVK